MDAYQLATLWTRAQSGTLASETPVISGLTNGASYRQAYAPGMILTVFGSQLAPSPQSASNVPLPLFLAGMSAAVNGVPAPLYYVSAAQVNLQIPYEISGGTAVLTVNNNGRTASQSFRVASAAPGIFTDQNGFAVPFGSATRGQVITLYVTGAGLVSPAVATGAAPSSSTALSNLPAPALGAVVTVGGLQASTTFIGIPPGLVGVVQINFQVPTDIAPGTQPVVVTVGGVSSPAANLLVN